MTKCNATLTTATMGHCTRHSRTEPGCEFCWQMVKFHTLTCNHDASHNDHQPLPDHLCGGTNWHDDTPGAKPHVEPEVLVTDEEFTAAYAAFDSEASQGWDDETCLRAALQAAARVRKQQEADRE